MSNNINSDIENAYISLNKQPKQLEKEINKEDNLDLFISSLTKDLQKETKTSYEESLNEIGLNNKEVKDFDEKYEVKDIKEINESVSNISMSLNNTSIISSSFSGSIPKRRRKKDSVVIETPNVFLVENSRLTVTFFYHLTDAILYLSRLS
jgi:hypothetical protein